MSLFKIAETVETARIFTETKSIADLLAEAKANIIDWPFRKRSDSEDFRNTRRARSLKSDRRTIRSMSAESDEYALRFLEDEDDDCGESGTSNCSGKGSDNGGGVLCTRIVITGENGLPIANFCAEDYDSDRITIENDYDDQVLFQ